MTHKFSLIVLFVLALMSPPLSAWGETTPPYPIVDSGVWATNSYPGDMYWLDNERVLFLGSETSKPIGQDDQWLLVWDTEKNNITKYKQHVMNFCYRNGIILYRVVARQPDSGKRTWTFYRGKLNEETIDQTPDRKEDKLNCRYISVWPKFPQGKAHAILQEPHGYLLLDETERNVKFENYPILYYNSEIQETIPLPFRRYEADRVNYYPFRQAYFLYPSSYFKDGTHILSWPPNISLFTWWIYPGGKLEKVEIPPGSWTKGALKLFPTREGVFLVNRHSRSDRDPGNAGGYLVQGTDVRRIISGMLTDVSAVSPDGCRVAFSHTSSPANDRFDEKNKRTLKMTDVCTKGVRP